MVSVAQGSDHLALHETIASSTLGSEQALITIGTEVACLVCHHMAEEAALRQ